MADLSTMPAWPRFLSREEAASYVGVSATTFDDEVAAGQWPPAHRRGAKGTRLTWDRCLLDCFADHRSGIQQGPALAPPPQALLVPAVLAITDPAMAAEAAAMRGLADAQARARSKRRQATPG